MPGAPRPASISPAECTLWPVCHALALLFGLGHHTFSFFFVALYTFLAWFLTLAFSTPGSPKGGEGSIVASAPCLYRGVSRDRCF